MKRYIKIIVIKLQQLSINQKHTKPHQAKRLTQCTDGEGKGEVKSEKKIK